MILADTSVWIDHLRIGDKRLGDLLNTSSVLMHPFVIAEIALGQLRQRAVVLETLSDLPTATLATNAESWASSIAISCLAVASATLTSTCSPPPG